MRGTSKKKPIRASGPRIEPTPGGHRLVVNDKPFLILGAELHNSSFSCPRFMQGVWPLLKANNVNTALVNVDWEVIEPEEGVFDFSRFDKAVEDARRHGLCLILLWFGAFKNGKSTYVPSWVKRSPERFPRVMLRKEKGQRRMTEVLSLFHPEAVKADAAAFRMLMRHIKEIDGEHFTILMVQVENEVGILGDSRDACSAADECFQSPVPDELVTMLSGNWNSLHDSLRKNLVTFRQYVASGKRKSTWRETFGDTLQTDELFMAYHYARYVEQIASEGKSEYHLPMFTNVWQNYADEDTDKSQPTVVGGGGEPGDYPSGGGVINVLDVWQHFAPSLDFVAPDLYLNDYNAVCAKYRHRGQPLFIPEQRRDAYGARRIWSAYGTHHALCTSPFGIDSLQLAESPWKTHYGLLAVVSDYVLAAQEQVGASFGFFFDEYEGSIPSTDSISTRLGEWNIVIERSFVFGRPSPGFGMVIQLAETRFMLIGEGFQVRFASAVEHSVFTGILSFVEKVHDPVTGELKDGRRLNGDETRTGEVAIMPSEHPDCGTFPICITIPASTRIAECEVYSL